MEETHVVKEDLMILKIIQRARCERKPNYLKGESKVKEVKTKKEQCKISDTVDEIPKDIRSRSQNVSLTVCLISCLIIMGIKMYLDQPYKDILVIFAATNSGRNLYIGLRTKGVVYTVLGVMWGIMSVVFLVDFLM